MKKLVLVILLSVLSQSLMANYMCTVQGFNEVHSDPSEAIRMAERACLDKHDTFINRRFTSGNDTILGCTLRPYGVNVVDAMCRWIGKGEDPRKVRKHVGKDYSHVADDPKKKICERLRDTQSKYLSDPKETCMSVLIANPNISLSNMNLCDQYVGVGHGIYFAECIAAVRFAGPIEKKVFAGCFKPHRDELTNDARYMPGIICVNKKTLFE